MFYYFFIAFWVLLGHLAPKSIFGTKKFACFAIGVMFFFLIIVILLNPISSDMLLYIRVFESNSMLSWFEALNRSSWEPGFVSYQWVLSKFSTSDVLFIIISVTLMWVLLLGALKKIILIKDIPLIIFGYLSFFYFYNFSSNVLRQGFAAIITLFVVFDLKNNNYKKAFVFLCFSLTFHISAVMTSLLFLVKKFKLSLKSLCVVFIGSAFLMVSGMNETLLFNLASNIGWGIGESAEGYTSETTVEHYGAVNRIDFLIFTSLWAVWGIWFYKKYLTVDMFYLWLIKAYLTLSSVYVLFGFIAYSDRLAAYAWFLIPILLFYPVINMKSKYKEIWMLVCIFICIVMFFYFDVVSLYSPLKLFY